jgi:capsular polysaccharide biosynthesis protein
VTEGFDAVRFVLYLRAHWRTVAISCGIAVAVAAMASLVLPKRFTSTARILIRPPAGLDPRAAMSVSPVYIESLRTFEHLASGDALFLRSLEHVGMRPQETGQSVDALKRKVLRVSKPVNTRIIEISVTLEDPRKAQALARYIAEQTVLLSRSLDAEFASDVAKGAESVAASAGVRLAQARRASESAARSQPVEAVNAELTNAREMELRTGVALGSARAELAELLSQDPAGAMPRTLAIRARIADLKSQDRKLAAAIATAGARVEFARQRREAADAELEAASKDFESSQAKMAEFQSASAIRAERLDVADPGIVPRRPVSPNMTLNVLLALLLSFIASVFFLAFRFGYGRLASGREERAYSHR